MTMTGCVRKETASGVLDAAFLLLTMAARLAREHTAIQNRLLKLGPAVGHGAERRAQLQARLARHTRRVRRLVILLSRASATLIPCDESVRPMLDVHELRAEIATATDRARWCEESAFWLLRAVAFRAGAVGV